jgi:branched-chain amino acid transport system substrate-binding protein
MKLTFSPVLKPLALAVAFVFSGAAHADINLGLTSALSGGSAPMGASSLAGAKVAVAEINAQGGVLGQKLVLIERDDQAVNANGPVFAQELIKSKNVSVLIGGCNTGVVLPTIPVVQDAKIPMIVPCATGIDITASKNTFVFRTSASDEVQTRMVLQKAKESGLTKVALLADTTAYGSLGRTELLKVARELKIDIVADDRFAVGDKDMTAQLIKAKEAGAQLLISWGIGPENAVIAKNRVKIGLNIPMIGSWTLSMKNFIDGAGKESENVSMPSTFLIASAKPGKQQAFVVAAAKEYGGPVGSGPAAAQSYDAVYLAAAAIEQAQSTDGTKIKEALENLRKPVEGIVRTYDKPFSAENHNAQTAASTGMGVIKNGVAVMVGK